MITFYGYDRCSTCRKARKWLDGRGIEYDFIDVTTDPPDADTFGAILDAAQYTLKELFNTSGVSYREQNMKERVPGMTREEAMELLSADGRLVKRPIVTDGERVTVGFDETRFEEVWGG